MLDLFEAKKNTHMKERERERERLGVGDVQENSPGHINKPIDLWRTHGVHVEKFMNFFFVWCCVHVADIRFIKRERTVVVAEKFS
jgi:hypothetical protein